VSASPVLVNEVKRFYLEFKEHFTIQLVKYQEQKDENKDEEKIQEKIDEATDMKQYIQ